MKAQITYSKVFIVEPQINYFCVQTNKIPMKVLKMLIGLLLMVTYSCHAQVHYLEYDPDCMERYNYEEGGSFKQQLPYYDYHVYLSDNSKVIFRVEKIQINYLWKSN